MNEKLGDLLIILHDLRILSGKDKCPVCQNRLLETYKGMRCSLNICVYNGQELCEYGSRSNVYWVKSFFRAILLSILAIVSLPLVSIIVLAMILVLLILSILDLLKGE